MAEDRMSQKAIDDLMKMLQEDPLGIEKTKVAVTGEKYICLFCHKVYRIVADREIPSLKLTKGCRGGCYVSSITYIKKKYSLL